MKLLLYFFALMPGLLFSQENQNTTYDIFVKNARVIDGSGGETYKANIFIVKDKIARIEKDRDKKFHAKKTIDASGLVLTPGFIDSHAHGDPLETPEFKNFLSMGVTTIALGQDGYSPKEKDLITWFKRVEEKKPSLNVAMFAGHNTLRQLSGVNYDTLPKAKDLSKMEDLLQKAFEAGVFGMTTGLEYNPGNFSKSEELQKLAKIVGNNNGLIMSHMRNEDDSQLESSIRELLAQGQFCPVHISHIKSVYGKGQDRAKEILQLLDSARIQGIEVTADLYPYNASYTGIGIVFPEWAKKPNNFSEVVKNRKEELEDFLRRKIAQRNGPEATLIGSGRFKGKNLKEISIELNKPFEKVLIEDIGPYGAGGAYFIMDGDLQESLVGDKYVNICSDGSPGMRHPRGYGSFAKVIETYVLEKNLFSLEEGIYKMTGLSAKILGIEDRGLIKEGYKADFLLFKPEEIKETASYEAPHQLAKGFKYVFVNGELVKNEENFSQARYGSVLKK